MTERVTSFERNDYPDMVSPTELRNLAEALENSNHAAEEIARKIKVGLSKP